MIGNEKLNNNEWMIYLFGALLMLSLYFL